MLKLNETPVRTSKKFNSNNIQLENVIIPDVITDFENITIMSDSSKNRIHHDVQSVNLTYGLSKELETMVNTSSNVNLNIEIDSINNEEVMIDFDLDEDNKTLIDHIQLNAKENAIATIIIKYHSSDALAEAFHNGIIKVDAQKNSNLHVIVANLLNSQSQNFLSMENTLADNAKVEYTIVDFGGRNSISNYYSNLIGSNCENKLNTIYLGTENQLLDLNYIAELKGEKSNINIEAQGALKDDSKKHFKGTIDFKKGCKKAIGNENESCMLLSDTAKSLALPMLLCSEEEVEGNHSTSTGKIGPKELFYIMSRGFSMQDAMKLLVKAKFNKILGNIENVELRNEIINEIEKRLD